MGEGALLNGKSDQLLQNFLSLVPKYINLLVYVNRLSYFDVANAEYSKDGHLIIGDTCGGDSDGLLSMYVKNDCKVSINQIGELCHVRLEPHPAHVGLSDIC